MPIREPREPYLIYSPYPCHQLPDLRPGLEPLISTSIDIGIRNFAIRIERRTQDGIQPMYFAKIDLTQIGVETSDSSGSAVIDPRILSASTQFLNSVLPLIRQSRLVGIERQLSVNVKATRMFQHVLTLLMVSLDSTTVIFDIDPKLKGRVLGAPKGLPYAQLKEWSVTRAAQLLLARNDQWSRAILQSSASKADDLADTILQMEAWFRINNGMVTPG